MGNNCNYHPPPDTTNLCSQALGETMRGPNFCTLAGSNNWRRQDYCAALGPGEGSTPDEWIFDGQSGTCFYDSCNPSVDFGFGCCRGCCGIIGAGVRCKRVRWNGEPLPCCLRDLECHPESARCFQRDDRKRTCPPNTRNQASGECKSQLFAWCSGADGDPNWIDRWTGVVNVDGAEYTQPCYRAVYRNLYAGTETQCLGIPNIGTVNQEGYRWAQSLVEAAVQRYLTEGGRLDEDEATEADTRLNATLFRLCRDTPGLCQRTLNRYCTTQTVESLIRRPGTLPWCGCYLPPEQYAKYTDTYGIARECTPMCHNPDVIPLPGPGGVGTRECKQTTCVIDDVTIALTQSRVGQEGITFSQLCSQCVGGTCQCTLAGFTFTGIDADIESLNLAQECGSGAQCFTSEGTSVPCYLDPDQTNPYEELRRQEAANRAAALQRRNLWIMVILVVVVIVIVGLWFILKPRSPSLIRSTT